MNWDRRHPARAFETLAADGLILTRRGQSPIVAGTAAPCCHSGGGATTLRHFADPVPEVDRRAAAYLAKLTARSVAPSG
jgi:hypothetical protein